MDIKRDFKGIWIPKEIWLTEELTLQEKIFLVEIDSLDNDDHCIANNTYFSKFFGISTKRVSLIITALKNKGFITEDSFDGRKRHLISNMEQKVKADENKGSNQPRTKVPSRVEGKFPHNNTTNNTVNNKPISIADKSAIAETKPTKSGLVTPSTVKPKKQKEENSAKEEKEFNFQEQMDILKVSKNPLHKIIRVYWIKKGYTFDNQAQFNSAIVDQVKHAKRLMVYLPVDIEKTMNYLELRDKHEDWEWKLTTVAKKIDGLKASNYK